MTSIQATEQNAPAPNAAAKVRPSRGLAAVGDFSRAVVLGLAYVVISYLAAVFGGVLVAGEDTSWAAFWFLQILIYAALSVVIVLFSQMIDERATDTGLGGPAVFLMSLGTLVSFAAFVVNEFKAVGDNNDNNIVRDSYTAFAGRVADAPLNYLIVCTVLLAVYGVAAGVVVWSLLTSREQGLLRKVLTFFGRVNTSDQQKNVGEAIETRQQELTRLTRLRENGLALAATLKAESTRRTWLVRQAGEFRTVHAQTAYKSGLVAEDAPDADTAAQVAPLYAAAIGSLDAGMIKLEQWGQASADRIASLSQELADLIKGSGHPSIEAMSARIAQLETETHGLRSQLSGAKAADGLLHLLDIPQNDSIHAVTRVMGVGMFVTVLLMTLNNYLLAPEVKDDAVLHIWQVFALLALFLLQAVAAYYGLTSARMFLVKRQIARRARLTPPGPPLAQRFTAMLLLGLLGLLIYTLMRLSEPSVARPLKAVDLTCRAYDDVAGYQTPQGVWAFNSAASLEVGSCRMVKPLDHETFVVVVGTASQEGDVAGQMDLAHARAHALAGQIRAGTNAKKVNVFVVNMGRANPVPLPEGLTPEAKQAATRTQRPLIVLAGNLEPVKPAIVERLKAVFVRKPVKLPQVADIRPAVNAALLKTQNLKATDYDPGQCNLYRYDGGVPPQANKVHCAD